MNYIEQLQADNKEMHSALKSINEDLTQFLVFLNSSKFIGLENGERKDWISTADVITRLQQLRQKTYDNQITQRVGQYDKSNEGFGYQD